MWPFKKRKKAKAIDYTQIAIDKLKTFRKIGEKFNYLGAEMIVTGHTELEFYGLEIKLIPRLSADYRNEKGEIKSKNFCVRELPALRAENV